MSNQTTQNQINKNKVQNNTLGLKNIDNLIKQILELKNADSKDIVELLTIASFLKYLEYKEKNDVSSFNIVPNSNNTKN
jgi:hypothetical protein